MSCHTGAYPLRSSLFALLSESSFGFGSLDQVIHHHQCQLESGAAPISIGHLPISSIRVGTAPISIGHSSCQFESGPHLYRSVIHLISLSSSRGRTYIDRSLSCQFESGPHLYQSAIFLSVQFLGPHRSVISLSFILSCLFESGPHPYRSAISLSVCV